MARISHRALSLRTMSLDECAARMTKLLAKKPRKLVSRKLLETLPKRPPIVVTAADYPEVLSKAVARAQGLMAERDAQRYAEWERKGKPPSPPALPRAHRVRLRPRARMEAKQPLFERLLYAQEGRCGICGEPVEHGGNLDHVMPRCRGGRDAGNLLATHGSCNSAKGSRMPTGCELVLLEAVNARLR